MLNRSKVNSVVGKLKLDEASEKDVEVFSILRLALIKTNCSISALSKYRTRKALGLIAKRIGDIQLLLFFYTLGPQTAHFNM